MSDQNPYLDTQKAILAAALPEVGFSGWSAETLARAAETAEIEEHMALLAFPHGVIDLVQFFSAEGDRLMVEALPEAEGLKIRERIAQAVMLRLEVDAAHREAARLAAVYLSVPGRHAEAAKMLFTTAHLMWLWAGDTATDYNYYTKRTILSGVIASTRLVWFDDDTPELQATQAFLDRRIDNVMQFEKVKGKVTKAMAKMQEEGSGLEQALNKLAQWRFRNDAQ